MERSKVETFIGFSIKSRKICLGAGAIEVQKGGVYLMIISADAAINTQKLAIKLKNRFRCPLSVCKRGFDEIVNKPNCKIAALQDKNLAKAVMENLDDNFEYYAGGNI